MELRAGRPEKRSTGTTISDLGISKDQSSKWQQLADVPEGEFAAVGRRYRDAGLRELLGFR